MPHDSPRRDRRGWRVFEALADEDFDLTARLVRGNRRGLDFVDPGSGMSLAELAIAVDAPLDLIQRLIKRGAPAPSLGFAACGVGARLDVLRFLAQESPRDVNARDARGWAPLMHACADVASSVVVRYLVSARGARVDLVADDGVTTASSLAREQLVKASAAGRASPRQSVRASALEDALVNWVLVSGGGAMLAVCGGAATSSDSTAAAAARSSPRCGAARSAAGRFVDADGDTALRRRTMAFLAG